MLLQFTYLVGFEWFEKFHENPEYYSVKIIRFCYPWEAESVDDWGFWDTYITMETSWENIWTGYSSIVSVLFISLFLLTLGLALPQKPKYIKFLNLVAALYILVALYTLSFEHMAIKFTSYYNEFIDGYKNPDPVDPFIIKENIINNYTFNWYPNGSYYSNMFFIIASISVILFLLGISDKFYSAENNKIEFLLLVIFIYIGAIFLLNTSEFISALILLECIAFSSYILVGFERKNKFSGSSGIKYLILGSVPGGFFVLGITLLYKNYGTFTLSYLEHVMFDSLSLFIDNVTWFMLYIFPYYLWSITSFCFLEDIVFEYDYVFSSAYVAILLIFANLLFKLTAAPLQMWAPSIYGGAPLASTTFLSIFSKLTIIFFSIYLYTTVFYLFDDIVSILLLTSGVLSIIAGMTGAFSERLLKRFFVYSSMGHVGFMLLGMGVADTGLRATINYLLVYVFSAYILWFTLMYLTKKTTHLTSLKGLSVNHPILSFILSVAMFSLSGIPPLAGFFVKFEIFFSVLASGNYLLLMGVFILTVFSFFYYLRIIKIIYFEDTVTIRKNKNQDLIKLRLLAILINVLLFFVIFVPEVFLTIIEESINWLRLFKL